MFITIQAVPCCACGVEQKTPSPDQSLMFTRLDLERNAKIMKKAVMDQRLDAKKIQGTLLLVSVATGRLQIRCLGWVGEWVDG